MKLRDVVDLEAQLALDEGQDEVQLRTRDRALYLGLSPAPSAVPALLSAWLEALRERFGVPRLGERVETAQRLLSYGLGVLGLTLGWGVAEALLHFEQGGAPVNVGHYLLVLVFGQLATLLLLGLSLLLRGLFTRLPVVGDVGRVLRFLATRLQSFLQERQPDGPQRETERAAYQRVRTRLGLYREVEHGVLLSQSQLFALAFNIGALASCLRLIVLSDLAFAWSTSVTSLDATEVQRVCAVLAWPFAWFLPDAVPSLSLIEHTQYFRLEGRFADAAAGTRGDPALAGEWWRFLIACTVCYGLLPRVATFVLFQRRLRRALATVPLDTPAVQRVLTRLTAPVLSTRGESLSEQGAEPARVVLSAAQATPGPTGLVLFRDVPTTSALLTRELARCLGLQVTSLHRAGGFDVLSDLTVCTTLAEGSAAVAVVVEAWEAPDKSLRGFLAQLRKSVGPRRTVRVVLIGEASEHGYAAPLPDDIRLFQDRLTLLEDPYLTVDTLPAAVADDAREPGPKEVLA